MAPIGPFMTLVPPAGFFACNSCRQSALHVYPSALNLNRKELVFFFLFLAVLVFPYRFCNTWFKESITKSHIL